MGRAVNGDNVTTCALCGSALEWRKCAGGHDGLFCTLKENRYGPTYCFNAMFAIRTRHRPMVADPIVAP
jgi:hypothetical protein